MEPNIHSGHRKRLKKEILNAPYGSNIPPEKLLEMLLFYAIPRKDTVPIAKELLGRFGSLKGVMDAEIGRLCEVKGVSENVAGLIKLSLLMGRAYVVENVSHDAVLKTMDQVGDYIQSQFYGMTEEAVALLCMNKLGEVLAFEFLARGSVDSVYVSPRSIVEKVIQHKASVVVLAHNHPGGVALPSQDDQEFTRQLSQVLGARSVILLDHIIVTKDDYISLIQSENYKHLF